jgi:sugar phosphate isomerase/epimerase
MNPRLVSRRAFLGAAAVLPAALSAVEPFVHKGPPRLRLSLAAYSFRDQFVKGKDGAPARIDMFQFIDFCADHGSEGAELTSYYFPDPATDEVLRQVQRHAFLRGVSISGTAIGNTFTLPPGAEREKELAHTRQWIARAAVLGAPHIRVFAGELKGSTRAEARARTIEALEEMGELAGKHGIFLGVENHGGIVAEADDLLGIVQAVKSPWVGINLDIGNFNTVDPYADLARCAPYAVNVQFKGLMRPRGSKQPVATDLPRVVKLLRDAGYQGWFVLEYEMPEDPYAKVPKMLDEMRAAIAAR